MNKSVDILGFNAVADASNAFLLSMKNADSTDTGVSLNIIGKNSDPVQQIVRKMMRKRQADELIASRKGKPVEPMSVEDMEEQGLELALVRVTGWKGVTQEFDKAILKTALKNNPHWVEQIVDASNDEANFTKAK